jgi:hypothetical protein
MNKTATTFLQFTVVLIGIAAAVFLIWEPRVEGVNANATNFEMYTDPFILLVYAGSIPFFVALFQAFKLLGWIGHSLAFTHKSVHALRVIKHCAMIIIGFVVLEELFIMLNHGNDDAAGAMMLGIFIILGSIIVVAAAGILERLLKTAVAMKTEHILRT